MKGLGGVDTNGIRTTVIVERDSMILRMDQFQQCGLNLQMIIGGATSASAMQITGTQEVDCFRPINAIGKGCGQTMIHDHIQAGGSLWKQIPQ